MVFLAASEVLELKLCTIMPGHSKISISVFQELLYFVRFHYTCFPFVPLEYTRFISALIDCSHCIAQNIFCYRYQFLLREVSSVLDFLLGSFFVLEGGLLLFCFLFFRAFSS